MRQIESREETNKKRGKVIHLNELTRGHSLLFAKPDREGGKQCEQCELVQRQKSAALHVLGISFFATLEGCKIVVCGL